MAKFLCIYPRNSKALVLHDQSVFFRNVSIARSRYCIWVGPRASRGAMAMNVCSSEHVYIATKRRSVMLRKWLATVKEAMIKWMNHAGHAHYRMELIYVQTRLKDPGSPELVLMRRKNDNLQFL